MSKKGLNIPGVTSLTDYAPNKVDLWISTGLLPVDYIINPSSGGIPAGRIITIVGDESSGKSTFLAHIFKSCQDRKIACVLCDAENTFDEDFASRVGLDPNRLGLLLDSKGGAVEHIESLKGAVEKLLSKFYKDKEKWDVPLVLGIDSLEALDTENYIKTGKRQIGDRARLWNAFWRFICAMQGRYRHFTVLALNQYRENIKMSMYETGPMKTSPGGKAVKFYSSITLELTHKKTFTDTTRVAKASISKIKVSKSKVGAPFGECYLYNRFATGFDSNKSILFLLADRDIIKKQTGKKVSYLSEEFTYTAKNKKTVTIKLSEADKFVEKKGWDVLKKRME